MTNRLMVDKDTFEKSLKRHGADWVKYASGTEYRALWNVVAHYLDELQNKESAE